MKVVSKEKGYGLWMLGKKASIEARMKMSESMKKNVAEGRHNFYIDGRTPLTQKLRHSVEYKIWRDLVFKKDDYRCLWCGTMCGEGKKVFLQADHILRWVDFPRLRLDVLNGQTLCYECHNVKTTSEKKRTTQLVFNYT